MEQSRPTVPGEAASVAQWIEQTRPKGEIGVRFPSEAQEK